MPQPAATPARFLLGFALAALVGIGAACGEAGPRATGADAERVDEDAADLPRDSGAHDVPDADAALSRDPDAGQIDAGTLGDAGDLDAAATVDAGGVDGGATSSGPLDALDDVTLYLNLGDSMGEGYNARSGRGYFDLVCQNHPDYPPYASDHLRQRFPTVMCRNRADSGSTSADLLDQTRNLPASANDTVVTIYVGGNDFNDEISTMILPSATQVAIGRWQSNMATVLDRLEARYSAPGSGRALIVLLATIHDPTDGTGAIPAGLEDGFCGRLQNPLFTPTLRTTAIANLGAFNDAIRAFAQQRGAVVIDTNLLFLGHGLNAPPADRWLDTDCAHGNDRGHHEIRREVWRLLTGRSL